MSSPKNSVRTHNTPSVRIAPLKDVEGVTVVPVTTNSKNPYYVLQSNIEKHLKMVTSEAISIITQQSAHHTERIQKHIIECTNRLSLEFKEFKEVITELKHHQKTLEEKMDTIIHNLAKMQENLVPPEMEFPINHTDEWISRPSGETEILSSPVIEMSDNTIIECISTDKT